ncbi:hypothetical protein EV214_12743 [Marinisporobacter balticus]|uniref:Uncharacterized protein n=1 Tax=Marinisporobacter balticus TaxID=2018667 RepID=A0A4R2KI62_9FIRM|nr:hypothetical protein EV214_12743 [Marinisporobacter balticus]
MHLQKKYIILTLFLLMIVFTSFYIFINKPKVNKYTKAKLVIIYTTDVNDVRV